MRRIFRLLVLAAAGYGVKAMYDAWMRQPSAPAPTHRFGYDTPTGTDPQAKWAQPGYEDKSLGQAVNQDQQLVDRLVSETHGDMAAAERRFEQESAGAPALARHQHDT